ncbi:hypothetical protein JWG39_13055 [Desulforhopalus vacuolatus]|uniref:hypothetical protein n=1 Tax=Desulforhopalus vacuolatus TaxID=40414 RepID=UPI001962E21E|nr:hypothetical protein [Desulforhopalus vacuolatus]MBM9520744.1 hypothetical protein [Desulforhopalus vacuolatus]
MEETKDTSVNSGVHTNIGMDFQKNCTIYLFLDSYDKFKKSKYFIILEHLEDIVFGFLDNADKLIEIETYQAKKNTNKWTLNSLLEIIKKISKTSRQIQLDKHDKSEKFSQKNYFATNNSIDLKCSVKGKNHNKVINEACHTIKYRDLDINLKNKICKGNKDVTFSKDDILNFNTLYFKFIDLSRTPKSQLEQLIGKFNAVFGDSIVDHKAALYTFILHLKGIESTLNQSNKAELCDSTKRIESNQIQDIINILTTKKMAYDFWRKKGDGICEQLKVSMFDVTTFELHYQNSFDKFKDLNESEHRKIHSFITENKSIFKHHYTDKGCISAIVAEFNKTKSTTLGNLQLKAIISAAYVEVKNTQ